MLAGNPLRMDSVSLNFWLLLLALLLLLLEEQLGLGLSRSLEHPALGEALPLVLLLKDSSLLQFEAPPVAVVVVVADEEEQHAFGDLNAPEVTVADRDLDGLEVRLSLSLNHCK